MSIVLPSTGCFGRISRKEENIGQLTEKNAFLEPSNDILDVKKSFNDFVINFEGICFGAETLFNLNC